MNDTEDIKIDIHCSTCKWYYCYNASMYCSHPKRCHKITAARKHGCKYWEEDNKNNFYEEDKVEE